MNRVLASSLLILSLTMPLFAAPYTAVDLPSAEAGQPRTRCASIAGSDTHLFFTRYWADVLPAAFCAFYSIPYANLSGWSALAPAPKAVQEPPSWFTTNTMKYWAGNGMSYGEISGQPFLFMFGSIAKGGTGEDIGRDLLGYDITADTWEIVTNRYDAGGADAACTFVSPSSIYGYWTGWTPMQRWAWDKNSLGVVQQATVGSSALHPVDGVRVSNLAVFVIFQSGLSSAKLLSHSAGTLDNQPSLSHCHGMSAWDAQLNTSLPPFPFPGKTSCGFFAAAAAPIRVTAKLTTPQLMTSASLLSLTPHHQSQSPANACSNSPSSPVLKVQTWPA